MAVASSTRASLRQFGSDINVLLTRITQVCGQQVSDNAGKEERKKERKKRESGGGPFHGSWLSRFRSITIGKERTRVSFTVMIFLGTKQTLDTLTCFSQRMIQREGPVFASACPCKM